MNIHIVACRVFTRSLSALVYNAPNRIEVSWLPQGLHDTPQVLHAKIEQTLEEIYEQLERRQLRRTPDCIVLGYGLCSNATVDIAARDIPLIVPKTDDCIALFLGSQARYMDYFERYKGTYWLNADWVENTPEFDRDHLEKYHAELMERFDDDEDTVEYLLSMEHELIRNYKHIGYIRSEIYENEAMRERAKEYARKNDLDFFAIDGSDSMLANIVNGNFPEKDFLIVPPGYKVKYSDGPERMVAVPV